MEVKHHETLDAMWQAYEARLKLLETLKERWRQYLDPHIKVRRMDLYQRLVETTQALMEENKKMQTLERGPLASLNPRMLEILIIEEELAMPKETK